MKIAPFALSAAMLLTPLIGVGQAAGDLDITFGGIGYVLTSGPFALQHAAAALIQADGRIIVSGEAVFQQGTDLGVARYLTDGELDVDFGTAGSVSVQADWTELVYSSALQPDGRSVYAGFTHDTAFKALLVRLDTSGVLDPTLGGTGTYVLHYPGEPAEFSDVIVQPDSKILVCGSLAGDMWLHRILPDGTPHPTFGTQGHVRIPAGTAPTTASTNTLQPNRQVVVAGSSIARFNSDGTLDLAFGTLGAGQLPADISDPLFYDV
ncbi:MAG TPA: hypothetical protein PK760_15135, partial [Flavobacteriales bacterium]|nr:hypothetical protein [Flavobacteriales bacterium]